MAGYVYVVDFEEMVQQRQNDPSRKRQVKRDLATTAKKGVAGLRLDGSTDSSDFTTNASQTRSPLPAVVTNNLISTIAATDAAISIANDIIDSTLAHASPDRATTSSIDVSDSGLVTNSHISNSSSGSSVSSRQDLLHEVEETLNISSAANAADTSFSRLPSGSGSGNAARLDFFSQTIEEFRSLALNNMAESSSDSDSDDEDAAADDAAQQTETELL